MLIRQNLCYSISKLLWLSISVYVTFKVAYIHMRKSWYNELGQSSNVDLCHLTIHAYNSDILAVLARKSCQIGLINREESYIYISELKVAEFSCQIDDLVVPIWPYKFFNALQSARRSDPNTVLFQTRCHAVWLKTARHRKTHGNVSCGRVRRKYHTLCWLVSGMQVVLRCSVIIPASSDQTNCFRQFSYLITQVKLSLC